MKKLLFFLILSTSAQLLCMEKDQQLFPWEQLPLELKTEVINSINVQSAIDIFKKLRATSKQYNTEQAITAFLDSVNTKSPGQEVRIARALHNQHAKEWLKKKKPSCPYKPIDELDFHIPPNKRILRDTLLNNPHYEKGCQLYSDIKKKQDFIWQLENGLNPNIIYQSWGLDIIFRNDKQMDVVTKLVSCGLNLKGRFNIYSHEGHWSYSLLSVAGGFESGKKIFKCADKIYEYLKNEGAD